MTWPTIALGWVVSLFQRGSAAMGRINEILEAPLAVAEPGDPVALPESDSGAALAVDRLTFAYPGRAEPALRDVSFAVRPGERVAIVGRTGSGKTTLLSLIPRLWPVPDGSILLDGVDINRLRLDRLRSCIGFVPQETFLFSDTLAANIALPEGEEDPAALPEVQAAGELAQFAGDVGGFPDGWGTLVGERGITLSGGQKQRAAIARALLRRPRLLIFDDALSSVDTETEERILDGVLTAHPERTVLFVSHRLSTMRRADRILVFDDGALLEAGTHAALMARDGPYRRLIDQQLLADELEREDL
jgi:ATP-binding cassette subfamily B protein